MANVPTHEVLDFSHMMLAQQAIPRDIAIFDVYVPTIIVLFIAGALSTWAVDRVLALTGLYRFVWHPALFRASLLACICGLLGLFVYS